MASQAPSHGAIADRQGRLTLVLMDDRTKLTSSATTDSTLVEVSRLESADWDNTTKVDQVIEIGTNGIVGGVVQLGEFKGKMSRQATSTKLLGLITGKNQDVTPGNVTTWNYFDLGAAQFDYARLLADQTGKVYAAWVAIDAVLNKAQWAIKSSGNAMEEYDCQGPQLAYINGFPVSKAYVVQAADVTAGEVPLSTTFDASEIPNRVLPPANSTTAPNSLYSSGRVNFLKVVRVPEATATIGGISYGAGSFVRYRENQDYKVTAASFGTIGAQADVQMTVGGTNYMGPEIVVGSQIIVDPGDANQETCTVTAITGSTITFTTTKTHATTGITVGLVPTSGRCLYNPLNGKMILGDALSANDVIRVLFASYDTASVPKTIATTPFDSTDVPGVPGRLTPASIGAFGIPRLQTLTVDVTISRKQVQGAGEDEVVYGTAGVPDIKYSLDLMPLDNTLIEELSAGTSGNGTLGDIYPVDYIARYMNTNATALTAQVKHPINNAKVLYTVTGGHPVFDTQGESGNANGELTQKYSGQDMAGTITVSATT